MQIHLIAPGRQKQDRSAIRICKDNGFCNLINIAPKGCSRIRRSAGKGRFADCIGKTCGLQCGADTFQTFAHIPKAGRLIRDRFPLTCLLGQVKSLAMPTDLQLARLPRPFDPEQGAAARALFPDLRTDWCDLIAGVGGTAPYLLQLMQRETDWIRIAIDDPDAAVQAVRADLQISVPKDLQSDLRQAKRRIALLTALMDIAGIWPLPKVTQVLTGFADLACDLALKAALAPLLARGKLPGKTQEDLETAAGMTILAMGKMGAGELNYSSDIDLICLFDQDQFAPEDVQDARAAFIKATRAMCKTLSDVTAEGYVFRTDLRLRPDPAVTPVCMAMDAAERYYETHGRTWERAAFIKARACAGDLAAGQSFLKVLSPFVWRKHLDFAAVEDAHNMRLAIREHKGTGGPLTLPGHDMKLGRGGIREIEFFTQTRQLIAGGRNPDLRGRETVAGLQALAATGWVEDAAAQTLSEAYTFHRTVEHRLQMMRDAQTHSLPRTDGEFERLACLMGMEAADLQSDLLRHLSAVHSVAEPFFAPDTVDAETAQESALISTEVLSRWMGYVALRAPRARTILERLRPGFESRLAEAARPADALAALDGFLARLPAGVQLLSLFEANPSLIDLVLDIVSVSPYLATYLSQNAKVLDAVIGGGFFEPWPARRDLQTELETALQIAAGDYEAQLDGVRRWMKERHFRIGVHLLRGLIPPETANAQYSDLAEVVLQVLWPCVQAEFARKHGPAPGRGAVILGMGALGAAKMNAQSDLDLIVIYDPLQEETSEGPRPLAVRPYYARLTQALITALSAPMAEGRLYEVDMRLRPSGNKGPVATSWESFQNYQSSEAWTWEHLALTRARVVAGPDTLAQDVETFRCKVLAAPRDAAKIAKDVSDMRARLAEAKPGAGWLDLKAGQGRLQDIELLGQTGLLLTGAPARDIQTGLRAVAAARAEKLCAAHAVFNAVQTGGRLLDQALVDERQIGVDGCLFLARLGGAAGIEALQSRLAAAQVTSGAHVTAILEDLQEGHDAEKG